MSTSSGFDAYHELLGIPPAEQPPNLYRLVGISLFESVPSVIERAADRQMSHLRSFQVGKHAVDSQRLLNEVSRARHILLNDDERKVYDAKLRKQLEPKSAPVPTAPKPAATAQPVAKSPQPAAVKPQPAAPRPAPPQPAPAPQLAYTPPPSMHSRSLPPVHAAASGPLLSPTLIGAIAAGVIAFVGIIVLVLSQSGRKPQPGPVAVAPTIPAQPTVQPTIPPPPQQIPGPPPPASIPAPPPPPPVEIQPEPPPVVVPVTPEPTPTPEPEPVLPAAAPPTPEPPAKPQREPLPVDTWVDLIPLIEFDNDLVSGEWGNDGKQLGVTGIRNSRLRFPVILTNCSYDFEVEFRLGMDHDDIHLIIPIGDQNVLVSTDSYGNRKYTYLDRVAGKEAWENPLAVVANLLQPNTKHRIKMSVRLNGDQAEVSYSLDGRQRYLHRGPTVDFQVAPAWSINTKAQPALAIYDTPAIFTSCRVKLVEGEGFQGRAVPLLQPIPAKYDAMKVIPLTLSAPTTKSHFEQKFGINQGYNPIISSKPCTEFIYAHAPSRLTYPIPAGAKAFTAVAHCIRSGSVKFIVRVDGEELFTVERRAMAVVAVDLPAGAKTLELECDPLDRTWDDDSCWCYPAFRE